jgi:segregation and condensation protein A
VSDVEPRSPDASPGGYSVTLPTFEGPLDLLLHLCQKHELDILDIPIGFVTEKYLEYLAVFQLLDLDLASEYLVMAATLAHIKSKMLLPAPPPGQEDDALAEDEEDPRESLIRRLLEYQKYKQAGEDLQARGVVGRDVFFRGMPLEEAIHTGVAPLAQVALFSLVEAFQGVLAKSKIKLSHDVVHERITLTDRINELVDVLRVHRRIQFEDLFTGASTKFDLVITFLALLEMTKLRMTRLVQEHPLAPIFVEFSAQAQGDDSNDENATAEEKAEAQAKADAEADANAEAHAREHAHEPHSPPPPPEPAPATRPEDDT